MSEINPQLLSGVAETMLITLYLRAMESQRPEALIKDEEAVELVTRLSYDFDRIRLLHLNEANKLVIILRNREFDRYARDFLRRHPDAVVVHIGCGLDSRFGRVDNGKVEWYDLDFPDIIKLRRKLLGDKGLTLSGPEHSSGVEGKRYHLIGCSVLEDTWLEKVSNHRKRPFLFMAEGVFMYFEGAQVKSLVLRLRDYFPGAELVFDSYSPIHVRVSNLQTASFGFRSRWGIWHGEKLEGWDGIRLLDEWGPFERPEPRLARFRWWLRPIDWLFRTLRIYHFQLGKAAG